MRLLIVDDGHYIVEYLKHLLDWGKMGIESVITTTNSIEAKQILDREQIDILITDIRMPEVSGIDLLEHVNKNKLRTKVAFLTGYSDFEYTQKAIRLGAVDYLLKPVDKQDMENFMAKVMESIVEDRLPVHTDWSNLDGFGYLLSAISHHCFLVHDDNHDHASFGEPLCFFQVSDAREKDEMILRDNCGGLDAFIWAAGSTLAGIVPASCADLLQARIVNLTFSDEFQLDQKNTVRHYFYQFYYNERISTREYETLQDYAALAKLEPGIWESVRKNIPKLFSLMNGRKMKIILLIELIHFLYCMNDKSPAPELKDWIFNRLKDPDAAFHTMMAAIAQMERTARLSNDDIIHAVQTYITDHLSGDLSLDELGRTVHLHPVYLSKLYKQETGENLSNYILIRRLEKAAKLLIDSSLHVVDIAQMVGYRKPQYFIKLFKDHYGITPQQYRKHRLGREIK